MFASVLLASLLAAPSPTRPWVAGPRTSEKQTVSYRFRSSERGLGGRIRFQCAVDAARLRACRSPYRIRLAIGPHLLRVRAVDRRGRTSPVTRIAIRILEPRAPETRVGSQPLDAVAVGSSVWTENYGDGTVSAVDTATRAVTSITVGGQPGGIAYGAGSVWVGDLGGGPLTRIDPASHAVVARIAVPGRSAGIAVAGNTVYVADFMGGLVRVDAATNSVLGRTVLAGSPEAVAVGFGLVWVTNQGTVSTLDPATGVEVGTPIAVGADADGVSIGTDGVWAVALYGKALVKIDPVSRQVVTRVTTPGQASGVLAAGGSVWASNYDRATVSRFVVAANRFVKTYRVGSQPRALAEAGGAVWVANQASNSVSSITP